MPIESLTFPNGLRAVLEPIPHVRSVSFGIWVKNGSRHEDAASGGISHFIEHMLFKGTKNRSAKQIADDMDAIGGQINAYTAKEYTCYYTLTLDTHFDTALDVLGDMFFNSKFAREDIVKERNVILEEISMYEDTPDELVHDLLQFNTWKDDPLGRSILGAPETISRFGHRSFVDYLKRHYVPESTVLALAGNFDVSDTVKKLEKRFPGFRDANAGRPGMTGPGRPGMEMPGRPGAVGSGFHARPSDASASITRPSDARPFDSGPSDALSAADGPNIQPAAAARNSHVYSSAAYASSAPPSAAVYSPGVIVREKDIEQVHVCLGFPGVPMRSDRTYDMSVFNTIFGGGMSSRLFQSIREERGLAYSIYSYNSGYSDAGLFSVYAACAKNQVKDMIALIFGEINRLGSDRITEGQLAKAKEQLKSNYILSLENTASRMNAIGKATLMLERVLPVDELIARIDAVSLERLYALVGDVFKGERAGLSAVGDVGGLDFEGILDNEYK
ncbi:MAG: insulinase family protein [Firmicutes bacterium]|nr:insulinase family protein [Bacillota bacterium]